MSEISDFGTDPFQYVRVLAERDALRAELAAAKEEVDSATRNWKLTQERATRWAKESTALAADNARLRAALEEQRAHLEYDKKHRSHRDFIEVSVDKIEERIASISCACVVPPAQSLAAHDAALLRAMAAKLNGEGHAANEYYRNWLMAEADRVEKEAPHA